jgi:diguanylate cyclase
MWRATVERFVMLFRGVSLSEAHKKLDGLREQMAERRLRNRKTDEPLGKLHSPLVLRTCLIS